MHALAALDSGHTGQGVTVAVIDDGVVNVNGELDGRIDTAKSKDFGYDTVNGVRTKRDELGDEESNHGTAVANIIAANRNGAATMGYAPDARIAVLRISNWDADTKTETLTHVVEALDYTAQVGIKLVNHSLGSGGAREWGNAVTRYGATGGLVVTSAGNESGADPDDLAAINDSNRGAVIFVGALSPSLNSYMLEAYSNRAGAAMDRYVVAVGSNVTTIINGSTAVFSGTSSAAPVVSALAATILSKWPQLTGQQAGEVILSTAKDIGDAGTDPVFGRGLVDFAAALSPVDPALSNGTAQTSLASSVMAVPAVMGIGSIQSALAEVTVLDSFGRDFSGSVAGMVIQPEANGARWLRRRVEQLGVGGGATLAAGPVDGSLGFVSTRTGPRAEDVRSRVTAGSLGVSSGRTEVRVAWNAQDSLQSDIMGLAPFADGVLAYAPHAGNSLALGRALGGGRLELTVATGGDRHAGASAATLGWSTAETDLRFSLVDEDGTIMGTSTGEGALRLGLGATTAMIEAHRSLALASGWMLEGYGSLGVTRLKIDGASLVTGSTPIIGSRLGLQARGAVLGGIVSLGVAQPLTVEAGTAILTYGRGYDVASRSLTFASTRASLAGERRVQLTAGFARGGARSSLRLGVMQDVADHATSALAGWSLRF